MANILILHTGFQGITNAGLEIARRFTQLGHQVFTSTQIDRKQDLDDNNFSHVTLDPLWFEGQSSLREKFPNSGVKGLIQPSSLFQKLSENLSFGQLDDLLDKEKIDLIFVDIELHEFIIHLSKSLIPFILMNQWYSIWQTDNNFPLSSTARMDQSHQSKKIWRQSILKGRVKSMLKDVTTFGANRKNFIKFLAKKKGVDIKKYRTFVFPSLYAYTQYPTVSLTHPDIEFGEKAFGDLYYTYPMVCENRVEKSSRTFDVKFSTIVNEIKENNKRLIVVTSSSMENATKANSQPLIGALSKLKNCVSIVSMSNSKNDLPTDSENVFFFDKIPLLKVLRYADLSINHGGIHTINECIHFATLMLIMSGGKYDQNGTAARIHSFGAGIVLDKNSSQNKLEETIELLLHDPSYKNKIVELNETYKTNRQEQKFEKWALSHLRIQS